MYVGPHLAWTVNLRKPQQHRHGGLTLEKPLLNSNVQDRYDELLNFEMEVTNILETKAYKFTHEEKITVIKNWLGQEDLKLIDIHEWGERKMKNGKRILFVP